MKLFGCGEGTLAVYQLLGRKQRVSQIVSLVQSTKEPPPNRSPPPSYPKKRKKL